MPSRASTYGRKLRVDRRQLAHPLPHAAERREDRTVALVERRVALLAEPLNPLGARQHLPRGRRALVLAVLRRRLFDLAELERDQIQPRRFLAASMRERSSCSRSVRTPAHASATLRRSSSRPA